MTLVVKFRKQWRYRCMEWMLSAGLTGWGLIVLQPYDLFSRPYYAPFRNIAPEWAWGWSCFLVGLMRLMVLFINGSWPTGSPRLRFVGSCVGLAVWSLMMYGTTNRVPVLPGSATYAMVFIMEAIACSFIWQDIKASGNAR